MKKLLLILLLASPVFADGPKYSYPTSPTLDDEIRNIYHDLKYPNWVYAKGSSATVTYINSSSITVIQINASTGTITNFTASSGTIKSFMVVGTATNDSAPTGRIGEYISATFTAQNFSATGVWDDAASISLTPGDWDISAILYAQKAASTVWSFIDLGISTVSGNSGSGLTLGDNWLEQNVSATNFNASALTIVSFRASLSATTTYYFKKQATWTTQVPNAYGRLVARRLR